MKLYKIQLTYGYENQKTFVFFVVAENIEKAETAAIETFKSYDYGDCHLQYAEVFAEEGQYSKPNILLIKLATKRRKGV